jgi:hypothetical protein
MKKRKLQPQQLLPPGVKRLKTEALVWYKHTLLKREALKESKEVEIAIKLNKQAKFDEAIEHLRASHIPMSFGWFVRTREGSIEEKRTPPAPIAKGAFFHNLSSLQALS